MLPTNLPPAEVGDRHPSQIEVKERESCRLKPNSDMESSSVGCTEAEVAETVDIQPDETCSAQFKSEVNHEVWFFIIVSLTSIWMFPILVKTLGWRAI